MKRLTALLLLALLIPASATAAPRALDVKKATRYAQRAATNRAKAQPDITGWELSRGIRFDRRKFVFVWYGQLADGRGCGAQLVVRYASLKSSKVIAYFRNEECS
jgi:hypothetical protein